MNKESIFPEVKILNLKRIGHAVSSLLRFLPETPLSRGDHTFPANHGAEMMLDKALDESNV